MNPILFAALSLPRGITDPASNPLEAAGWLAGVYAVLRIIWANYKDQLPTFLATILSRIPGFGGVAPILAPTVSQIIQQLVDKLLAEGLSKEEVSSISTKLIDDVVPKMNRADVNKLKSAVVEKCGQAPSPVPGE